MQPDPSKNAEVRELTNEAQAIVALAQTYHVQTAEQYAGAGEDLKRIKGASARLDKLRKTMTQPIDQAKRAIMDFFRPYEVKLSASEATIKRSMIAYSTEQDRIRREEQRKAEEAARKEREKLEAQAAKAAAAGRTERAEQLEERAATVVAPVIQREAPKVAGVSMREVWKFEIVDPAQINAAFLMPDEKKIGAQVRALKADATAIIGPGVRVYVEKQLAAGAA